MSLKKMSYRSMFCAVPVNTQTSMPKNGGALAMAFR